MRSNPKQHEAGWDLPLVFGIATGSRIRVLDAHNIITSPAAGHWQCWILDPRSDGEFLPLSCGGRCRELTGNLSTYLAPCNRARALAPKA